jgi:hypothetical protein
MSPKNSLDRITVHSPCSNDWNSMTGNDQVRFCEHCSFQVHNLSEMTSIDAMRLIARSRGRLCVRYHRDPNGEIVARKASMVLHRIGRRASRIAAGAFSATLSLTSAMASPATVIPSNIVYNSKARRSGILGEGATILGTVADLNAARVAGASVTLANTQTGSSRYATTNDAGEFRFEGLSAGTYKIRVEAPGFAVLETESIFLEQSDEVRVDRILNLPIESVTVGMVVVLSPKDPFVRAAQEDNLETVQALIAEVNVNVRDKETGTTALEHAVMNGNQEMVQLLLSRGADINSKNTSGHTVLMILSEDVTSDLVWELINAGAKLEQKDADGNTALINLAYRNNVDSVKTLLEAGAKVNAKNKQGQTALMIAASNGLVNNVRALVLAGADLNATDNEGKSALSYAIEEERRAVVRFLRSRGAIDSVASVDNEAEDEE